jgi:hypothetical protein
MDNQDIIIEIGVLFELIPDLKYYKYNEYPNIKIGNGNPYYKCAYCGISDPQINMDNKNHSQSCQWVIAQNKLQYLKGYLNDYEKKNLNQIIEDLL